MISVSVEFVFLLGFLLTSCVVRLGYGNLEDIVLMFCSTAAPLYLDSQEGQAGVAGH